MNKQIVNPIFLLGIIVSSVVYGILQSEEVMYASSTARLGFIQLYLLDIVIVAGVSYLLLRYTKIKNVSPQTGYLVVILSFGITLILGHRFSYNVKTDEFLFYFLMIHINGIFMVMMLTRVFFTSSNKKQLLVRLLIGIVAGLVPVLIIGLLELPVIIAMYVATFCILLMMLKYSEQSK